MTLQTCEPENFGASGIFDFIFSEKGYFITKQIGKLFYIEGIPNRIRMGFLLALATKSNKMTSDLLQMIC